MNLELNQDQWREIRELIEGRGKIEAIKRFRELTGVGLAEAKAAVDAIEALMRSSPGAPGGAAAPPRSVGIGGGAGPLSASQLKTVVDLVKAGRPDEAALQVSAATGLDQDKAREFAERLARRGGASGGVGCFRGLLGLLFVIGIPAGLIMGGCSYQVTNSTLYACLTPLVEKSPAVRERYGSPVEMSWFFLKGSSSSSISMNGAQVRFQGSVRITGPKLSERVTIQATRRKMDASARVFADLPDRDLVLYAGSFQCSLEGRVVEESPRPTPVRATPVAPIRPR